MKLMDSSGSITGLGSQPVLLLVLSKCPSVLRRPQHHSDEHRIPGVFVVRRLLVYDALRTPDSLAESLSPTQSFGSSFRHCWYTSHSNKLPSHTTILCLGKSTASSTAWVRRNASRLQLKYGH